MYRDDTFNPMEVIVNHSSALVYVIDLQTYEIIYANNKCKDEFGDIVGNICYKVLQKNEHAPCSFCPMQRSATPSNYEMGTIFEWENKNSINGRTYFFNDRVVEWRDKRKVKIQIGLDITIQKELEEKISKLAYFDTLTNLPNRDSIKISMQQTISKNCEFNSILFIDLDNFKLVNDIKGHDAGDIVLVETKNRIQKCIEQNNTLGRVGGVKFVILAEINCREKNHAMQLAKNLSKKILQKLQKPYIVNDYKFFITASIGIVIFNNEVSSCDELMKFADSAVANAKKEGKNRFCFFDPKLQQTIIEKAKLTDEIRTAIHNEEFVLYYQSQIFFNETPKVIAVEALVRWRHQTKGIISPASFIPLAEESGLIIELGKWILQEAIKQLKLWENDTQKRDWRISVNISIKQFEAEDFIENLQLILDQYRINTSLLRLELTENLLINDIDRALEKLFQLKSMGISISIDDFGTGYSSLAYLKILPIDELKIDQSFVHDIVQNSNDEIITQTIISIGQKFGLDIIAEGVETQEQCDRLLSMGCNLFQGYLFQKPTEVEFI